MYEEFFGLRHRPFGSIPDAECLVEFDHVREAMHDLTECVRGSQGIGVLIADDGLGKTLVCKKLAQLLESESLTVYLTTSAFHTRRAFLQSTLYELGIEYLGFSEEEARLKIFDAIRELHADGKSLLLILDEADALFSGIFEEIRGLVDFTEDDTPLVHAILSGNFGLEESLAAPEMDGIRQRIGSTSTLRPLSHEESAKLVTERLHWAGSDDVTQVITDEALELICQASAGNPRCVVQLADHSCLMAFAEEQTFINTEIVRAALNDVKMLPLAFNEASPASHPGQRIEQATSVLFDEDDAPSENDAMSGLDDTAEFDINEELEESGEIMVRSETSSSATSAEEEIPYAVFEVGQGIDPVANDFEKVVESIASETTTATAQQDATPMIDIPAATASKEMIEEVIMDRYAFLDRIKNLPPDLRLGEERKLAAWESAQRDLPCSAGLETELLESVTELQRELLDQLHVPTPAKQIADQSGEDEQPAENAGESRRHTNGRIRIDGPEQADQAEQPLPADAPVKRFAQLFRRLRQRRQRIQDELHAGSNN